MADNERLRNANKAKNDEFYTQLSDIEKEMRYYIDQFKGKVIFCNCDDPEYSNFWKYFELNFTRLGLKKLIATHYETEKPSYKLEIIKDLDGDGLITSKDIIKTPLKQNGDFRSPECIELLKEADIVITNPPFSLFREYIAQLIEYDKKFLIIGNINAISYREIFPLLRDNKMWLGASIHSGDRKFLVPEHVFDRAKVKGKLEEDEYGNKYVRVVGVRWMTNLDYKERHDELILYKNYNETDYPKYANYDAINCDLVVNIPCDYKGKVGVPVSFMDKYNPEQFKIIGLGISNSGIEIGVKPYTEEHKKYRKEVQHKGAVDGDLYMLDNQGHPVVPYARIIIEKLEV